MRIWAATGTLACSLFIACVETGHADDNHNEDLQIHNGDQRYHQGAHLPVYRIKSLCAVDYACVPVPGGMNAQGEASGTVWRVFEDESYGPFSAFVWHPATESRRVRRRLVGLSHAAMADSAD